MATRALVIAIEHYSQAEGGFTGGLPGTHENARKFCQWLLHTKKAAPEDLWVCVDAASLNGLPVDTIGATADDLREAVAKLVAAGEDTTDELFFFFSGHGLSYTDSLSGRNRPADVLVAADFKSFSESGNECLRLDEIQNKLRLAMGPGDHYYFIDACRYKVRADQIEPGRLGKSFSPSQLGQPVVYTLYSTSRGAVAATASGFGECLASGLEGRGRAKVWHSNGRLTVLFNSLKRYIRHGLQPAQQEVDSLVEGDGDGVLLEVTPVPEYDLSILVEDGAPDDSFSYRLRDSRGREVGRGELVGAEAHISQVPDDYYVDVFDADRKLVSLDPQPVDLYQHGTVRFRKDAAGEGTSDFELGAVELQVPRDTEVVVRDLRRGREETRSTAEATVLSWDLPAGDYSFALREPGRPALRRREISITSGQKDRLSLRPGSRRRSAQVLRRQLEADPGRIALAESVGPMADDDLGVWLSLLGASRIVGGGDEKLDELPLESFEDLRPGATAVYLLATLRGADGRLRSSLSRGAIPTWETADRVEGVPGLYELRLEAEPGSHLLSVRMPAKQPYTFVTHCLSNRVTLLVLTDSDRGGIDIKQYLLPAATLLEHLEEDVRSRLPVDALKTVRYLAEAQRRFARKKPLAVAELPIWNRYWESFLEQKWLDPIMALLASYELLRRGSFESIPEVLQSLRRFFPGLPDTEVLARLADQGADRPSKVPLLLEGLLALGDQSPELPLPESHLDYTGPWTAWIGGVDRRTPWSFGAFCQEG